MQRRRSCTIWSFWPEMAASERTHVQSIQRMQELVRKLPHLFKPLQQFQPASMRLFELAIRNLPDRTRLENISREELLGLVVEVENSAVEMNYGRIGTTGDEEFNHLTEEIDAETAAHGQSLSEMLARNRFSQVCRHSMRSWWQGNTLTG